MRFHSLSFWALATFGSLGVLLGCGGEIVVTGGSDASGGESAGGRAAGGQGGLGGEGGSGFGGEGGVGGSGAAGGFGGQGGAGGGGTGGAEPWPTCEGQQPGSVAQTLDGIWGDNPPEPTRYWVENVIVTGVSKGGCAAGEACALYVQTEATYADLSDAAQKSLRIGIAPAVASGFTEIRTHDRVDIDAYAFRDQESNELYFLIGTTLPGCINTIGKAEPEPVLAELSDLTLEAYEDTLGPVFVRIEEVAGTPDATPVETFGLRPANGGFGEPGTVTSLSPYFMNDGAFVGLTAGQLTFFSEVVGVFGVFTPDGDPTLKFEELHVRMPSDYVLQ